MCSLFCSVSSYQCVHHDSPAEFVNCYFPEQQTIDGVVTGMYSRLHDVMSGCSRHGYDDGTQVMGNKKCEVATGVRCSGSRVWVLKDQPCVKYVYMYGM